MAVLSQSLAFDVVSIKPNKTSLVAMRGAMMVGFELGGRFVKMVRLWIELRCEPLDIFGRDSFFLALKTHANSKIVEPFDHGLSPQLIANYSKLRRASSNSCWRLPCTHPYVKARQNLGWRKS